MTGYFEFSLFIDVDFSVLFSVLSLDVVLVSLDEDSLLPEEEDLSSWEDFSSCEDLLLFCPEGER